MLRACAYGLLAAACAAAAAVAQDAAVSQREYNVKAASLYAFGRYVTWPASAFETPASPLVIGVIGENPFGDALERIAAKKTVNGRPLAIRQLETPEGVAECHMVFVNRTVTGEAEAEIFKRAADKPVLLVGESPGFAQRGGIVNFYQNGANVRFELNPERGAACSLSLDARLLSLGTKPATSP